jgi:hypothetical protein
MKILSVFLFLNFYLNIIQIVNLLKYLLFIKDKLMSEPRINVIPSKPGALNRVSKILKP